MLNLKLISFDMRQILEEEKLPTVEGLLEEYKTLDRSSEEAVKAFAGKVRLRGVPVAKVLIAKAIQEGKIEQISAYLVKP